MAAKLPTWRSKIKRYSIRGRWYWYRTEDGGCSWMRISTAEAMRIIDALPGVVLA